MQDQNDSAAKNAAEAVEATAETAGEKIEAAASKTAEVTKAAAEEASTATETVVDQTAEAATEAGEKVEAAADATVEAAKTAVESTGEAVEKATEAAASVADGATDTAAITVAEGTQKASEVAESIGLSSHSTFLMGLILLGLFIWYFVSEQEKRRRVVGSILAVVVAALCTFFYQNYGVEKGIELQGGVSMEIKIKEVPGREVTSETQQQVIKILDKRINALGARELILAPSGKDGVFLQVPGATPEELKKMTEAIQKVAKLEFSVVHESSRFLAPAVASDAEVIVGYQALPYILSDEDKQENIDAGRDADTPNRWELVKQIPDMSGKNVQSASYYYGTDGHSIQVSFTTQGAAIMGPLTRENQGRQLAIIMDNEVVSAPVINEPFAMGCSITGDFSREEAKALVAALENPLENPIEIAYSNYISPTMGELTVNQGIYAGIAGLSVTLLFILAYYKFAGIIALIGLLLNIVIIFGALALFRFTLTLPGIAGIILTIGVAIDANVLIYERLREELKGGKSIKAAIDAAYEKAFSAIIDANITTLITAIILYFLATGTVKGFAITLIIGIVASLFTALIVTRLCFGWATETFLTKLSFMNIIPDNVIDFLGKRKTCMMVSIGLIVLSLIIVPVMDPRGVELKGGDALTIQSSDGLTTKGIVDSLSDVDLGATPIVQDQEPVGGQGKFFLVRVPDNTAELVQAELAKDLGVNPEHTEVSSVGSQVGKSMLIASGIALLVGMVIILLYVTFRFEFAFALGAIVALFHDLIITAGVTTLLGQELSLISVGALLTIAGYSINDTIVVFDRVREGLATKRGNVKDIMNYCLNATLSRTILTSATTLIIVVVLFLFGGPGMRNFALTLIVGVTIGTYSSIFVASPIVLWWARRSGTNLRREVLDTEQSKIDPLAGTA
ncbi:MAG: protein translocase subunit SecD [Verrucomicrobiales bacterium]|nr:protein translocase subunit SecD [Verrucomicrobiales bacterium]